MSSPTLHTDTLAEEADRINWAKVVAVAVAAFVGFAISILFASALLSSVSASRRAAHGLAEPPKGVPGMEVGVVNQRPFALDPRAAITRDAQLKYLHSYGWVDRKAKTIHIPIDKAMEMYVAQQGSGQQR